MANLTIDIGNSSLKWAVFEGDTMLEMCVSSHFSPKDFETICKKYDVKKTILSSVLARNNDLTEYLQDNSDFFIELTSQTPLPLKIAYETPQTLGHDRIASAVGAVSLKPDLDLLVIDAGTCNTYDFISVKGVFEGGNITPGVEIRMKSMHAFTGSLPDIECADCSTFLGTSTATAMQCGAFWGIVYEIDGFINELKSKYPNLLVFLTGGYGFYFEKRIKNRIFAVPNLVHIGLNKILNYNDSF